MDHAVILVDSIEAPVRFFNETLRKALKITDKAVLLTMRDNGFKAEGLPSVRFDTAHAFLDWLMQEFPRTDVLFLPACAPLFDVETSRAMLENHSRNAFDYTYPENIPQGLLPEIFHTEAAVFIKNTLPASLPLFRLTIRELFERELSSYDTNIHLSDSGLVRYRVPFIPENRNAERVVDVLLEKAGPDRSIRELEDIISSDPFIVRQLPTYYELELTTVRESGGCFAGSLLARGGEMDLDVLDRSLYSIMELSGPGTHVSIGLYGEPFLHSSGGGWLDVLARYPGLSYIIETRGLTVNAKLYARALQIKSLCLVADISAAGADTFARLKKPLDPMVALQGLEAYETALKGLEEAGRVYPQFTRCNDNEAEVMAFFERWKDYSDRIIIKKPDIFSGALASQRVVDLSPVRRTPCVHLRHDLVIHCDGRIPLCREDLNAGFVMGSLTADGLAEAWKAMGQYHALHWKNGFEPSSLCKDCDEWWVFNF